MWRVALDECEDKAWLIVVERGGGRNRTTNYRIGWGLNSAQHAGFVPVNSAQHAWFGSRNGAREDGNGAYDDTNSVCGAPELSKK